MKNVNIKINEDGTIEINNQNFNEGGSNMRSKTNKQKVLIDSMSAINKIEPFIAAGVRGLNFIINDNDLEDKVINSLQKFSQKYRMQVVVKDKPISEMIGNMVTNSVVGANIGLSFWIFVPFSPGLATCVFGGAAIGALSATLKIVVIRDDSGRLVLQT